uniref:AlNc14C114G6491 protein n=1 Tax=Albugo laibachii Nc14 TaxID=890382 RepID=F0WIV6_9STRA|nr:AlNc14C114G6491 [Albugo laibachii Nc14]|eukprot:CCA21200.1 AlNc14C114G6491 [Albugo laibachii Nc14]
MTTIGKYISRFRYDSPRSRQERRKRIGPYDGRDDFWWNNELKGQAYGELRAEWSKNMACSSSEANQSNSADETHIILETFENTDPKSLYTTYIVDNVNEVKEALPELTEALASLDTESNVPLQPHVLAESEVSSDRELVPDSDFSSEVSSESDCDDHHLDGQLTSIPRISKDRETHADEVIERVRKRLGLLSCHAADPLRKPQNILTDSASDTQCSVRHKNVKSYDLQSAQYSLPCIRPPRRGRQMKSMDELSFSLQTSSFRAEELQLNAKLHGSKCEYQNRSFQREESDQHYAGTDKELERNQSKLYFEEVSVIRDANAIETMQISTVVADHSCDHPVYEHEQIEEQASDLKKPENNTFSDYSCPEKHAENNNNISLQKNEEMKREDITVMDTLNTLVDNVVHCWKSQTSPPSQFATNKEVNPGACREKDYSDCLSDGCCELINEKFPDYQNSVHAILAQDPIMKELQQLIEIYEEALSRTK